MILRWIILSVLGALLLSGRFCAADEQERRAERVAFFEKKIRPVLVEHCYKCHSQKSKIPKGGLLLDTRTGLMAGGDSGPAVVPGKADESLLIESLKYDPDSFQMPPKGKLPQKVIDDFVHWVRTGAVDPRDAAPPATAKRTIDLEAGRKFWSFQPPRRYDVALADPGQADWIQQRIDSFILARLQEKQLSPSPEASRRVLARRAYFDLVGLAPTPEEIDRFVADKTPDAYERLIDRLLASPHYGQRWGRYWLDLARYTDSTASWLNSTGAAWLYRDWVVNAFNADVPYDQFVRRQLATDMMPETGPEDSPALGFFGLSPTYWKELKLDKDVIKVVVAEEWEERIDALGRTFLGLSLGCARCHDHKFDPVDMDDYYALAGVFASTRLVDLPLLPPEQAKAVAAARAKVKPLEDAVKKLQSQKKKSADVSMQIANLKKQIDKIRSETPHFDMPQAHGLADESIYVQANGPNSTKLVYKPGEARDLKMHVRGNPARLGPEVKRRFLAVMSGPDSQPFTQGSGRLELADALVREGTPLTARVIVNRVWRHHFGRGLVDTPSDFGSQGSRPSHPQLLDDLTACFIDNGWSIKWLHREIMLSATYRQASDHDPARHKVDPDNRWLWRMNRRRLDIEAWRDTMLSVAGRLDPSLGGESQRLQDAGNRRRTIYGHINRRDVDGLLRLYDFPDPTSHSPGREPTTTALQQLFVLNSPFIAQQSAALTERLLAESKGEEKDANAKAIEQAYRLLYGRRPDSEETRLGVAFLAAGQQGQTADRGRWQQYLQVLLGSNELMFID